MSAAPSTSKAASDPHIPVMLPEVLSALAIQPGEHHADGTFGYGGYSRAMTAAGAAVTAFDRDPAAIASAKPVLDELGDSLTLHHRAFAEMADVFSADAVLDGVVFDIGVSSMQIDQAERGFSYNQDGPLDMRMAREGMSAADFLNDADEAEIADIIYLYGEERQSRRIARAIVAARPLERTAQLASTVRRAVGYRPDAHRKGAKDPAIRTFQALRIHVNGELAELERGLEAAERLLRPGGRLVVVTFHSLEDRIVKRFLRERSGSTPGGSRHMPDMANTGPAPTFLKPAKPVRPSEDECARNSRARSATLRSAVRSDAPAWHGHGNRHGEQGRQA